MLVYVMPAMMVVFFFNFASGLNLYYTVQNVLSLPQQYWIAKRRLRQTGKR
jgi:membrane protein insertase Oxa1/YidC/SpoIIIJ